MSQARDEEAKQFTSAEGKVNIYVVRPSIVGGRYAWTIQVDGKTAGSVGEHTFLLLTIEPGSHEIAVQTGENRHAVTISASAGENHFIEVPPKLGWTESRAEVRAVEKRKGESFVRNSQRVGSL